MQASLLDQGEQALPHTQMGSADEGLCCHPPRPVFGKQRSPLGTVVVALEDCVDGAPQMSRRNLGMREAHPKQTLEQQPLRIREHPAARPEQGKREACHMVQELTGPREHVFVARWRGSLSTAEPELCDSPVQYATKRR